MFCCRDAAGFPGWAVKLGKRLARAAVDEEIWLCRQENLRNSKEEFEPGGKACFFCSVTPKPVV